ncbi:MAG: methyltransferase domain-containing protein [Armatimonadia bacterium]
MRSVKRCILCGGGESSLWLHAACPERPDELFDIVECKGCGLRYVNPRPEGEALAGYYAQDYYSYVFQGVRPRSHRLKVRLWRALGLLPPRERGPGWRWKAALFAVGALRGIRAVWAVPAQRAGARFLDIGGGAGERLELARDMGWQTFGLDMGEAAVGAAAERGHRMVAGDAQALPFADQSMDFVNMSHVLEHTLDPLRTLRECRRVLKQGGVAQITVPNTNAWTAQRYGAQWRALDVPRHLYHFTEDTVRRTAAEAGLLVVSLRTMADLWVWEESRKAAGEGPPGAVEVREWSDAARRGAGENLDVWCVRAGE